MEIIPVEIIVHILNCFGLNVVSQLSFLMVCKHCYHALPFLIIKDSIKITSHSSYLKHYHFLRSVDIISRVTILPRDVQTVTFSLDKSDISLEHLPPSVEHLTLPKLFNKSLPKLPSGLKSLIFGFNFNKPIDHLPSSLIKLRLGSNFNQPINHLPSGLIKLELYCDFNKPIDHLPSSLIKLRLGSNFNQPIDHLPPNLRVLRMYFNFNQPILSLPASLKFLHLSWKFNQSIDNCLPEGLEELYLGSDFNQPIHHLPASLIFLYLDSSNYTHILDACLLQGLKILKLRSFKGLPDISTLSFDLRIHVWEAQVSDSLVITGNIGRAIIYRRKRADE